jgi:hypothetical protein
MLFDSPDLRRESNARLASQVKTWVTEALHLDTETTLLVTERQCSAPDCPPVETVIAVMPPEQPIQQYKIHKPLHEITLDDVTHLTTVQSNESQAASAADEKEEAE